MKREINENGKTNELKLGQEPAFPCEHHLNFNSNGYDYAEQDGMSKRYYAACAALIGIIANNTFLGDYEHQVNAAYQYADELLKQE